MLLEKLIDEKTYRDVIDLMSRDLIVLPRSRLRIRDPFIHVFTEDEARQLAFRSVRQPGGPGGRPASKARPYLPKWLADEPEREACSKSPRRYRVTLAQSAAYAINRVRRLMRADAYEFSRLKAIALLKNVTDSYEVPPPRSRLPITAYRGLAPAEKRAYRIMVKARFPDALVLGAMRALLGGLFPDTRFLPECCGYLPGRGQKEAVRQIMSRLRRGYGVVLKADVRSFNDTVPQDKLLALVRTRALEAGWPEADIDLFERLARSFFLRVDEVLGTPGVGIGMGTALTPVFTNIYLNQLDHFIRGREVQFSRLGDDLALFFADPASLEATRTDMATFVSGLLGQEMSETKAKVVELASPAGGHAEAAEAGFDFGAYHFVKNRDGWPRICIKAATMAKIRRRIKLLTRVPKEGPGTDARASGRVKGGVDAYLLPVVERLSALLGFPSKGTVVGGRVRTHALRVGWPPSFLNDASSEEIKSQFKDLDRYSLYRLRRVAKALGEETDDRARFRQKMRDMGLRTFIDAWNRHPRPYRY